MMAINIMHLKYAVEVEKTRSISKAAQNLLMGQPNLSRAIKDLEESLGVSLFKRTSRGILLTPQGEEFIQHAKKILAQIDKVEALFKDRKSDRQEFSISVPRASYISCAFTEFAKGIDSNKPLELIYNETNSMSAIENILEEDYNLAVIRYQKQLERYFKTLLHEKGLDFEVILEFSYLVLMSKHHPLAGKDELKPSDLRECIEIAHADPIVPSMSPMDTRKTDPSDLSDKHIFAFERETQFDLLSNVPNTFMWVSPVPRRLLEQYGLVQKKCGANRKKYKDVLVYKKGYHFSEMDKKFISCLKDIKSMIAT